MAGDEGFEPPILGPEPSALPLGQSPIARCCELLGIGLGTILSNLWFVQNIADVGIS